MSTPALAAPITAAPVGGAYRLYRKYDVVAGAFRTLAIDEQGEAASPWRSVSINRTDEDIPWILVGHATDPRGAAVYDLMHDLLCALCCMLRCGDLGDGPSPWLTRAEARRAHGYLLDLERILGRLA